MQEVDMDDRMVEILYAKGGQVEWRLVLPLHIQYGSEHHPNEWVLIAVCAKKQEERSFPLSQIERFAKAD